MIVVTAKPFCFFILLMLAFSACKTKTNFNDLTEVSYVKQVAPVINANCAFSGCHGNSPYKKISIINYEGLINGGIVSGYPESSKLYLTLKTLDDEKIMPKRAYSALTEKQIQLIYVWIGQGAKNN